MTDTPVASSDPWARVARSTGPALLFGIRLWASVCLALGIAFWLELDNAYWAGTTAALVCQPSLGASLRKGAFRMVGTVIGAVAVVVLTAAVPQDRVGFLVGLALWGAACGFMATILRNFAAYAAALAGYTAAIIAADQLGVTGGPDGQAFTFAVSRSSEILIGILCAGIVLVATDFGGARRRLAAAFAGLSAEITERLIDAFLMRGHEADAIREIRRKLVARAIALGSILDETIGESSDMRYHARQLYVAVDGLYAALSGWRTIANHLERLPEYQREQAAETILQMLPEELRSPAISGNSSIRTCPPRRLGALCADAERSLGRLQAGSPSLQLLADRTADALRGVIQALDGLALLADERQQALPGRSRPAISGGQLQIPDWFPPLLNATRVFVTIGAVALFWIVTAWPNGGQALIFTTVGVILFSPKADQAYAGTMSWLLGSVLAVPLAAIAKFAILPAVATFPGFCLAIGLILVPAGALATQPWQAGLFTAMAANFIPLLAPENVMTYDTQEFLNSALAIVGGGAVAALSFQLLRPLSPPAQARRLLALTLRDLRRLATRPRPPAVDDWKARVYSRISALPEAAAPVQRAQIVAMLSIGVELIRLRRAAGALGPGIDLDAALASLARSDSATAIARFSEVDRLLAEPVQAVRDPSIGLRARSRILAISEALDQYSAFFDGKAPG
jgi:uncharacterized membrane protein YccC